MLDVAGAGAVRGRPRAGQSRTAYLLLLAAVLAFGVPATALAQTLTINPTAVDERSANVSVSVSLTGGLAARGYIIETSGDCAGLITASTEVIGNGPTLAGTITLTTGTVSSDQTCTIEADSSQGVQAQATLTIRDRPNRAPRVLLRTGTPDAQGNRCGVKTNLSTPYTTYELARGAAYVSHDLTTRVITDIGAFPSGCYGASKSSPIFDDQDGDTLTITMTQTLPDNIVALINTPRLIEPSAPNDLDEHGGLKKVGKVIFSAAAARAQTDVRFDLTATDPSGAAVSTHVIVRVQGPPAGSAAPSIAAVGNRKMTVNVPSSLQLPAATGGDVLVKTATGIAFVTGATVGTREVLYGYKYEVTGLPAGLTFDAATRTISGTPTATGSSTVTYTAEDVDATLTTADRASQSFTLEIVADNNAPRVLEEKPADSTGNICQVKTGTGQWGSTVAAGVLVSKPNLTTRVSTDTGTFPATCSRPASKAVPVFDDVDADRLTITTSHTLPPNVILLSDTPDVTQPSAPTDIVGGNIRQAGKVWFHAVTAAVSGLTDVRVDVTATDPSGAAASTYFVFSVPDAGAGTSAPSLAAVAAQNVALERAAIVQLPAATGGDFLVKTAHDVALVPAGTEGTRKVLYGYDYEVSGLPAGLTFDERTRTIRGIPTEAGSSTVTYTAADADATLTDADKASRTFRLNVVGPAYFSRAAVNTSTLRITFTEHLDEGSVPAPGDFHVTVGSARRNVAAGGVVIDGAMVALRLESPVTGTDTVKVRYTQPTGAGATPLRNLVGTDVTTFGDQPVANETAPDAAAPTFRSASVNGAALTLVFSEPLDPFSVPAPGDFTVTVGSDRRDVADDGVAIMGANVTLTLASAVWTGQTVKVRYTKPTGTDANPLRNAAENDVASFGDQAVTDITPTYGFWSATLTAYKAGPFSGCSGSGTDQRCPDALSDDTYSRAGTDYRIGALQTNTDNNTLNVSFGPGLPANDRDFVLTVDDRTFAFSDATITDPIATQTSVIWSNVTPGWTHGQSVRVSLSESGAEPPGAPPALTAATVNATALTLAFDKALGTQTPAAGAFTVTADGARKNVSTVAISGADVTLTLASTVAPGQTVTVGYAPPATNWLRDADGNGVKAFSGWAVTNETSIAGTGIWSATLTVATAAGVNPIHGCGGFVTACTSQLTDVDFDRGGQTYNVEVLRTQGGTLFAQLSSIMPSAQRDLVLTLGNLDFRFSDARFREIGGKLEIKWSPAPSWSTGQMVAVSLSETLRADPPPALTAATVNGTALALTFGEALAGGTAPDAGAFTVTVDGTRRSVSTVAVSDTKVNLTLASAVALGQTVTVGYAPPAENWLRDAEGNGVKAFSAVAVTNNSPHARGTEIWSATLTAGSAGQTIGCSSANTSILCEDKLTDDDFLRGGTNYEVIGLGTINFGGSIRFRISVSPPLPTNDVDFVLTVDGRTLAFSDADVNDNPTNTAVIWQANHGVSWTAGQTVQVSLSETGHADSGPSLVRATVSGSRLALTFDEDVHGSYVPAPAAFPVAVDGASLGVTRVWTAAGTVVLELAAAVSAGTMVTVGYEVPAENWLRDAGGNAVQAFAGQPVTHDATALPSSFTTVSTSGPTPPGIPQWADAVPGGGVGEITLWFGPPVSGLDPSGWHAKHRVHGTTAAFAASTGCQNRTFQRSCTITGLTPGTAYDLQLELGAGTSKRVLQADNVLALATPVPLTEAAVNGTSLVLTFGETLGTQTPAAGAFTVLADGSRKTVSTVAVSGTKVTLTLGSAAVRGQTVTVDYERPATNWLRAATGSAVESFSGQAVTNNTPKAAGTGIWSATLTVGQDAGANLGCSGTGGTTLECSTRLSDDDFSRGGTDYTISAVLRVINPNQLSFALGPVLPAGDRDFVLTLGDRTFATSAATVSTGSAGMTFNWSNPGLGWSVNQQVSVSLAEVAMADQPPAVTGATVNGTSLVLTFGEALASQTPAAAAFTVLADGARKSVSTVAVSGTTVTLTLGSAVLRAQTVTVGYAPPSANWLRDAEGNGVKAFSGRAVTNYTPHAKGTGIWSATLTVGQNAGGDLGCSGFGAATFECSARLSDDDFSRAGTDYTISSVLRVANPNQLTFALGPVLPAGDRDFVLTLGDRTFATSDATISTGGAGMSFTWANPALSWSVSQSVTASLSEAGTAEADPPPALLKAVVSGDRMGLTFDEPLASGSVPAAGAFMVEVDGVARGVTGVAVLASTVELTLASAVSAGQTVTVGYTPPAANWLRDAEGNGVKAFSGQAVEHSATGLPKQFTTESTTGTPPAEPTSASAVSGPGHQQITVAWTGAAAALTGWKVQHAAHGTTTFTDSTGCVNKTSERSCVITGLTAATSYDLRLWLQGGTGNRRLMRANDVVARDANPPALSTATVNGTSLVLTYDEALSGSAPPKAAFTVTVAGANRTVDTVTLSGMAVTLTLASAVAVGEAVTVSYRRANAGAQPLRDSTGNRSVDLTNRTVTNNTPPAVSVSASTTTLAESKGATFIVRLDGPTGQAVTVDYALTGTATHGTDYTSSPAAATGTLTFAAGTTQQLITLAAEADNVDEPDETVVLTLSNVSTNAILGTPSTTQLSIADYVPTPGVAEVVTLEVVSNPGPDLMYAPGDTVRVALTFSEAVNVGLEGTAGEAYGKPRLKFKMDPTMGTRRALYESGGGSDRLVFAYTLKAWDMVPAGSTATGLSVVENSLELNCGRIHSAVSGDWALLAHRGLPPDAAHRLTVGTPDLSGDTAWPQWQDSWVNGTWLTIEFDEPLDPAHTPPGSAFTVVISTRSPVGRWQGTGTAIVAANEVRVKLAEAVTHVPGSWTVHYDVQAAGGSGLRDLRGNWVPGHPRGHGWWTLRHNSPPVMVQQAQQAQAVEGQAVAFELALAEPTATAATVDYETGDGTAVAGEDYEAASGTVRFAPGERRKMVQVRTLADRDAESVETLRLKLANPVGLVLDEDGAEATATIANAESDETAPVLLAASAAGDTLTLTFDEPLDTDSAPAGNAFTVTATPAGGEARTIAGTGTAVFGAADGEVAVTLAAAVAHGEALAVAYTAPQANALKDLAGNPAADFAGSAAANATAAPDSRPAITAVAITSAPTLDADADGQADTYGRGATVEVTVTWDADVTWDLSAQGAKMRVRLDLGGAERGADLVTGGETGGTARALAFRYAVHRTDAAPGGLFPTPAADGAMVVLAGGATLKGANGRHAHRTHAALAAQPGHRVDGTLEPPAPAPAALTGVTITSTPATDTDGDGTPDTYGRGETVEVTVTWDATVTWNLSAPGSSLRVRLDVGGAKKGSALVTGGASAGTAPALAFRYTVHRTDRAPDGVFPTPAANGNLVVAGRGATLKDAEGRDALRAHAALAADPGHRVNGARDASAPTPRVRSAALVSDPGPHGVYGRDDLVRLALTFSEVVQVDTAAGIPSLLLKFDRDPTYPKKAARYESGSGTATLVFAFGPVAPPNHSAHGVALLADTLALNGGAIRSVDSLQDAALAHPGLDHDPGHRIDSVLPFVRSAHADGNLLTVVFDEDLDPLAPPAASAFTVIAGDAVPRRLAGTGTASVDGAAVTVRLSSAARWGETLRAYYVPDGVDPARDLAGNPAPALLEIPVENRTPRPNRPATGAPVIAGLAQVGETLTASADGIADPDGMTGAVLAWQWMSNGGGEDEADADIAGATESSYELVEADEGRTVRVRVSFTDDAGYAETLLSQPTGPVAARPLTAEFVDLPAEHGGYGTSFEFGLVFSEDFPGRFDYKDLRAAFVVENGRVVGAERAAPNQNRRWTITVRPWSYRAVTVTLPAGSVTTASGRALAAAVTATVRGPVALLVADARASEGANAVLAFAVTLNRAASGAVTVEYLTRDGTATAGEDYTATSGTLSFAAGELAQTVSVLILDDALDEGEETFTLQLRNAQGAVIGDGEATGTIENSDPLQKMWLARFGRTAADHLAAAVSGRLSGPVTGAQVTVGGQTVNLADIEDEAWLGRTLTAVAQVLGAPGREITGRELLLGSAFDLGREGDGETPGLAAWGRVTVGGFDGEAPADSGTVRIDGEVTTGIIGTDADWNRVLVGAAVSVSDGAGTFDQPGVDSGTIESRMTTLSPYARVRLNDWVSAWGLAGYGIGEMTIVQAANARGQPERVTRTDLSLRFAALGGRGALLQAAASGGFGLALKADGFYVETSESVFRKGDTTADASRLRLTLEGSHAFPLGPGVVTPGLEIGVRYDGGDAETGLGVELGGRVSWTDPGAGLSMEANARALVAHDDAKYREWGASGALRLAPGEHGRGLSFSLAPTWGAPGSGVDRLWSAPDARALAPGAEFDPESRLQGELGYGLPLFGDRFTGTPNLGFGLTGAGARDYRIGWRLTSALPDDPGFEVSLDATRKEPATTNGAATPPEHGLMLHGTIRW